MVLNDERFNVVKFLQSLNIEFIFVTELVSNKFENVNEFNLEHPWNIDCIIFTELVSKDERSKIVKSEHPKNIFSISVIELVLKFENSIDFNDEQL